MGPICPGPTFLGGRFAEGRFGKGPIRPAGNLFFLSICINVFVYCVLTSVQYKCMYNLEE